MVRLMSPSLYRCKRCSAWLSYCRYNVSKDGDIFFVTSFIHSNRNRLTTALILTGMKSSSATIFTYLAQMPCQIGRVRVCALEHSATLNDRSSRFKNTPDPLNTALARDYIFFIILAARLRKSVVRTVQQGGYPFKLEHPRTHQKGHWHLYRLK